jgi:rubredoxin
MAAYSCPCCGYLTLIEQPPGTNERCPVCDWIDDALQYEDVMRPGGANTVSLDSARRNYEAFGAKSQEAMDRVRPAKEDECA